MGFAFFGCNKRKENQKEKKITLNFVEELLGCFVCTQVSFVSQTASNTFLKAVGKIRTNILVYWSGE